MDDDDCFFGLGQKDPLGACGCCGLTTSSDDAVFADDDDARCFSLGSDAAGRIDSGIDTILGESPRGDHSTTALGVKSAVFGDGGPTQAVKPSWGATTTYCGSLEVSASWHDHSRKVTGGMELPGAAGVELIGAPENETCRDYGYQQRAPAGLMPSPFNSGAATARRGSNSQGGTTSDSNSMHSIVSMASMATANGSGVGMDIQHGQCFSALDTSYQPGGGKGYNPRYSSFTSELKTVGSLASMNTMNQQQGVEGWGCHPQFTPQLAHVASWPHLSQGIAYPSSASGSPTTYPSSSTMLASTPSAPSQPMIGSTGNPAKRIVVPSRRATAAKADDANLMASFVSKGKKRAPGSQSGKIAPNPNGLSCTACGTQTTPVWRAGPHGPKTLCNACGVRYMKVAKRK